MSAITKTALNKLVRAARKGGYYHDQASGKLWTKCPICGENVYCQDYAYGPGYGRRTTIGMLDAGMSDHIEHACSECPKCYALRGDHEKGCADASV